MHALEISEEIGIFSVNQQIRDGDYMADYDFGFYRGIVNEIEFYENYFLQLDRDYQRESSGEKMVYAVDFSELHDYIHLLRKDAQRADINNYLINNLDDQFTLLPGAVGELFTDIEDMIKGQKKSVFFESLDNFPSVKAFIQNFSLTITNEDSFLEMYADAEPDLKNALTEIISTAQHPSAVQSSILRIKSLLDDGKISPIQGVNQISSISDDTRKIYNLIENHLSISKPNRPMNNQADAIDFTVAWLLNQNKSNGKRYISIYTQSENVINACRSHKSLRWENDYIVRDIKYLQYRTKIQEHFPNFSDRQQYVKSSCELCSRIKHNASGLVRLEEIENSKFSTPPYLLLEDLRRFSQECKEPLKFVVNRRKAEEMRAKSIYRILRDNKTYEGGTDDAVDILKLMLSDIQSKFNTFSPITTDTDEAKKYKQNLLDWLANNQEQGKPDLEDL